MPDRPSLKFLLDYFKNHHIPCRIYQYPLTDAFFQEFDLGLRQLLFPEKICDLTANRFVSPCEPNTIYYIIDTFQFHYIFFRLPKPDEADHILIGPYSLASVSLQTLLNGAGSSGPAERYAQLEQLSRIFPVIEHEDSIFIFLNTFGEQLWGNLDNFSVQRIHYSFFRDLEPVAERPQAKKSEDASVSMQILETRYSHENQLMQAVSLGQTHKALMLLPLLFRETWEARTPDAVRNTKNYMIIVNTLLRKAAEFGGVHPLHIDSLSTRFALRIERLFSEEEAEKLRREMVRKYCLLVRNHSMKGYSILIRKVLTRIDSDLTADLGLKTQAELLNVNSSYLSALFKKETGSTLTEYVNKKRIEYGIFLLNTTSMKIQDIAQNCGMPDVNYFTKTFKKMVGKTPKDYRKTLV